MTAPTGQRGCSGSEAVTLPFVNYLSFSCWPFRGRGKSDHHHSISLTLQLGKNMGAIAVRQGREMAGASISSGMEYRLHWWKGTAFRTFLHLPGHQSKQWLLCQFGNPTGLLAVSLPDHPLIGVQALSYRKLKITNNCFMTGLSFLVKVHSFINNLSSVSSLGNANIFLQAS